MRSTRLPVLSLLASVAVVATATAAPAQEPLDARPLIAEDFSSGLDAWRVQPLDRRATDYRVVEIDGDAVLQATSDNAAAALLLPVEPRPAASVRLRWRWRVIRSLAENSEETEKDGDDYAARVFVIFGDPELNSDTRALAYAWAGQQPIGSLYPNPYISEVVTIVLRSGDADTGAWIGEDRDIAADYERAFGEPPPDLAAIALVVDTDDTGSEAVSWFDDFELLGASAP